MTAPGKIKWAFITKSHLPRYAHRMLSGSLVPLPFSCSFFPRACRCWSVLPLFFHCGHRLFENDFIIFTVIDFGHFWFSSLQKCWCTNWCRTLKSVSALQYRTENRLLEQPPNTTILLALSGMTTQHHYPPNFKLYHVNYFSACFYLLLTQLKMVRAFRSLSNLVSKFIQWI